MDCADYCLYCDGDTDSDGNRILHRVLNKKSRLKENFQTGFTILAVVIPSGFEPEAYCLEGSFLLCCRSLNISVLMNSLFSQRSTIGQLCWHLFGKSNYLK